MTTRAPAATTAIPAAVTKAMPATAAKVTPGPGTTAAGMPVVATKAAMPAVATLVAATLAAEMPVAETPAQATLVEMLAGMPAPRGKTLDSDPVTVGLGFRLGLLSWA